MTFARKVFFIPAVPLFDVGKCEQMISILASVYVSTALSVLMSKIVCGWCVSAASLLIVLVLSIVIGVIIILCGIFYMKRCRHSRDLLQRQHVS